MKRLLTGLQIYTNKLRDHWSSRTISVQLVAAICVFIIFAIVSIWLVNKLFIYMLARSYTGDIAYVFSLNKYLANAIALTVFLVSVYFVGKALSFSRTSRRIGYLGIMAILIGHSLLLWHGTGNQFFDEAGHPTKCYVLTRDGEVRFLELGR